MRDSRLWTWHLGAGAAIALLLGLHMVNMHLDALVGVFNPHGGHPIDWANVAARARHGGFLAIYIGLLGTALFHGLYGFRNILFELNPGAGLRRTITVVVLAGGFGLFALGTVVAVTAFQQARLA